MKKKKNILSLLLCLVLAAGMFAVSAGNVRADTQSAYIESNGVVTDSGMETLDSMAQSMQAAYGVSVYFLNREGQEVDSIVDVTDHFIEEKQLTGGYVIFAISDTQWYITSSKGLEPLITSEQKELLWNAYDEGSTYYDGIYNYLEQTEKLFADNLTPAGAGQTDAQTGTQSDAQTNAQTGEQGDAQTPAQMIPEERQLPRLVDDANLLSDSEEQELLAKLDEISERQQMDVAVVTVDSLEGKTPEAYADDFYDYNGYGMGEGDDGVLLLVAMGSRDWQLSTYGYGITAFPDKSREYIERKVVSRLSEAEYYQAFDNFATASDKMISAAKAGKPFAGYFMPTTTDFMAGGLLGVILGAIVSLISAVRTKRTFKTVRKQNTAFAYLSGGSDLRIHTDHFRSKNVTKEPIHDDRDSGSSSSSSRSSSTTHTSSSGRTHGGYGGKF